MLSRNRGFSRFIGASYFTLTFIMAAALLLQAAPASSPPVTTIKPVSNEYHEVTVTEDYRWLENFDDDAVKEWNDDQDAYTRSVIDNISCRESVKRQLTELLGSESTTYYRLQHVNGKLFAFKSQPPAEQPFLIVMDSPDDPSTEKIIVDVNELDPEATTSMDFYVPSRDASLVAVSLSEKGSEIGTVHIFDVAMGTMLEDRVPRVNGPTAGGDVAWNVDGDGFFYTRYPRSGERPDEDLSFYQQVFYHKLGTSSEDDLYVVGKEFPRIAEIQLVPSDDGQLLIAKVANGDGGEYGHWLRDQSGNWTQITQFKDLCRTAVFGPDNSVYFLSRKETPRGKIIRLAAGETDLSMAVTIVEQSEITIKEFLPTEDFLYVTELDGGPTRMQVFDKAGDLHFQTPILPVRSIGGLVEMNDGTVLLSSSSYTQPSAWYRFDPTSKEMVRTALYVTSPADFSDIEVVREFATSKDGTRVPMSIIRPKGIKLDGKNPTILYGYGGYGISLSPRFDASLRLWFDQGGVYVIANLRGGGEYGEEWHLAGNLTNKQNVFDDFAACAEYLIENKYTNSSKLAIKGGSNGGLLMGAAFTQHPELFACVVSYVGIYDMLRVELDPNGVFNITEFGTVKNPDHFKALHAYSPYHNVNNGTSYPPILFLTGRQDGRVNPYQSRKMTARMQAASSSGKPVLLRTSAKTGHGGGTALSERIEREADVWSFIVDQLDIKYKYDK